MIYQLPTSATQGVQVNEKAHNEIIAMKKMAQSGGWAALREWILRGFLTISQEQLETKSEGELRYAAGRAKAYADVVQLMDQIDGTNLNKGGGNGGRRE